MKHTIEQNSSESITVVTDSDRLAIKTEFKGYLPDEMNRYKLTVLNKAQARRLLPILNQWVNGGQYAY